MSRKIKYTKEQIKRIQDLREGIHKTYEICVKSFNEDPKNNINRTALAVYGQLCYALYRAEVFNEPITTLEPAILAEIIGK